MVRLPVAIRTAIRIGVRAGASTPVQARVPVRILVGAVVLFLALALVQVRIWALVLALRDPFPTLALILAPKLVRVLVLVRVGGPVLTQALARRSGSGGRSTTSSGGSY